MWCENRETPWYVWVFAGLIVGSVCVQVCVRSASIWFANKIHSIFALAWCSFWCAQRARQANRTQNNLFFSLTCRSVCSLATHTREWQYSALNALFVRIANGKTCFLFNIIALAQSSFLRATACLWLWVCIGAKMFSILFIFSPRFDLLKQIEDVAWNGKMKEKPFHAKLVSVPARCYCYCCRCKSFCCISDNVNSDWLIDFSICTRARPYNLRLHSIKWLCVPCACAVCVCVLGKAKLHTCKWRTRPTKRFE